MAFWSKLGRGLVKVGKYAVPIALGATGVGIPAAMAAGAGLSALDKKLEGGTWKGALVEGALGAAGGYGGGSLGSSFASALGKNLAKEGVKAGTKAVAGEVAKKAGMSAVQKVGVGIGMGTAGMGIAQAVSDVKNRDSSSGYGYGQEGGSRSSIGPSYGGGGSPYGGGTSYGGGGGNYAVSRQNPYQNTAQRQIEQNLSMANPFARAMAIGRQNAILSQPFRGGNAPPPGTSQEEYDLGRPPGGYLPPIFPQGPYGYRSPQPQYEPPPQPEPQYQAPEPQYQAPEPQYYEDENENERRRGGYQY